MKRIVALFLIFLLFGCATSSNVKKEAKYSEFSSNLELINSNMDRGKYKKAIEIINFLIDNNLKDVRLYYDRGLCLSNLGLYVKAINDFDYVIKHSKDSALKSKAYISKGFCYNKLDNQNKAEYSFKESVKLDNNYLAFYSLGYLYMKKNQYVRAKIQFYRAISKNSQFVPSYIDLSKCFIELGEFKRAKQILLAAENFDSNNPEVCYNLGYVYNALDDYNLSILYYTKALNLTPMFAPAYINRGLVYLYLNKKDMACSDFKQACNLSFCDKLNSLKQIGVCQ